MSVITSLWNNGSEEILKKKKRRRRFWKKLDLHQVGGDGPYLLVEDVKDARMNARMDELLQEANDHAGMTLDGQHRVDTT